MITYQWIREDNVLVQYDRTENGHIISNQVVCIDEENAKKLEEILDDYDNQLLEAMEEY
jgi:hypothetical protein